MEKSPEAIDRLTPDQRRVTPETGSRAPGLRGIQGSDGTWHLHRYRLWRASSLRRPTSKSGLGVAKLNKANRLREDRSPLRRHGDQAIQRMSQSDRAGLTCISAL